MSSVEDKIQELDDAPKQDEWLLEDKVAVIDYLRDLGCCTRCILIYLGVKHTQGFIDNFIRADEKLVTEYNSPSKRLPKKVKRNLCISCIGILENSVLEEFIKQMPCDLSMLTLSSFQLLLTIPRCVLLRVHSVYLHLREHFPCIPCLTDKLVTDVKKVCRMLLIDIIVRKLEILYNANSEVKFEFKLMYDDDTKEIKDLNSILLINKFLDTCDIESFKKKFAVPPDIPVLKPTAKVSIFRDPIYLGGRYLKFSRCIGQSPWTINGKPVTETSVQEIIFDSIKKVLGFNYQMKFSASGREDADVRMLGNGRPFYIQIDNPIVNKITFEQFRDIETEIIKSKKVAVIRLQKVSLIDLRKVKDGEEFKNKSYSAICHTPALDIASVISKINGYKTGLQIMQKTPIRVFHRRTLDVRNKTIFSMEATAIPGYPNLLQLDLVTQAGTYVKEFVNSDFDRTQPSLSSIIQDSIDVMILDVMDVSMKWP